MWYLKYRYRHSDCIYSPKLREYGVNVHFYHLGRYREEEYVYTSSLQHLFGEDDRIDAYKRYLREHDQIVELEDYGDTIVVQAEHDANLSLYNAVYDQRLLYPAPSRLEGEHEVLEVASWKRGDIETLIEAVRENETTEYFEILKFVEEDLDDIYVARLLPELSTMQDGVIRLAFALGYYRYPRDATVEDIAERLDLTKQTVNEHLRKAEAKLLPHLLHPDMSG